MSTVDVAAPAAFAGPVVPGALTLRSAAAEVRLHEGVAAELWKHLDLDPDLDLEVAVAIPPNVLDEEMERFRQDQEISAGVAGRISMLFAKVRGVASAAPASSGGALPLADVVPARVKGKTSMVLDQADESSFEVLGPAKRAEYRNNHKLATGGPPPPKVGLLRPISSRLWFPAWPVGRRRTPTSRCSCPMVAVSTNCISLMHRFSWTASWRLGL